MENKTEGSAGRGMYEIVTEGLWTSNYLSVNLHNN